MEEDQVIRALMLEAAEISLRNGLLDNAKAISDASKRLGNKIAGQYDAKSWEAYETLLYSGAKDIPTYEEFKEAL